MWYRSSFTGKIINGNSTGLLTLVFGESALETFVEDNVLKEIEPPSVIDILVNNGSIIAAATRYQEIHKCNLKTALEATKKIREDMLNIQKKEYSNQWKKSIAKIASTENQSDTDK